MVVGAGVAPVDTELDRGLRVVFVEERTAFKCAGRPLVPAQLRVKLWCRKLREAHKWFAYSALLLYTVSRPTTGSIRNRLNIDLHIGRAVSQTATRGDNR